VVYNSIQYSFNSTFWQPLRRSAAGRREDGCGYLVVVLPATGDQPACFLLAPSSLKLPTIFLGCVGCEGEGKNGNCGGGQQRTYAR
jgi:hypothetical protein